MSVYNYITTLQPSTGSGGCVTGCFLSPNITDLIVSKGSRLEIYREQNGKLILIEELDLFCNIEGMATCSVSEHGACSLFILTDRQHYCFLHYEDNKIKTQKKGSLEIQNARLIEHPVVAAWGPITHTVFVSVFSGFLTMIPVPQRVNAKGKSRAQKAKEISHVFIEETTATGFTVLGTNLNPSVSLIYNDEPEERRFTKTYDINGSDPSLLINAKEKGRLHHELQPTSYMLIPVPSPREGIIVVADSSLTYFASVSSSKTQKTIPSMEITAYILDRVAHSHPPSFLLSTSAGDVYRLAVHNKGLKFDKLDGKIPVPRSMAKLEEGLFYSASGVGDSVLFRVTNNAIEVVQRHSSLGPITDFCVFDLDKQGRKTLVSCSGVNQDGSLAIVQSGVGFSEETWLPLPGIERLWTLKIRSPPHELIVISTFFNTHILKVEANSVRAMSEYGAFKLDEQTLYAGLVQNALLHITPSHVRLMKLGADGALLDEWCPKDAVHVAAANDRHVLVGCETGTLICLAIEGNRLVQKSERVLDPIATSIFVDASDLAVVGLWGGPANLQMLELPGLTSSAEYDLNVGNAIPRSILMADLEGQRYLFVSLSDGQMVHYTVQQTELRDRAQVTLGTYTASLSTLTLNGSKLVFAASDHTTLIHSTRRKIIYSAFNLRNIQACANFNGDAFPDAAVFATPDALVFGTVATQPRLHFRKIPLDAMATRLAFHDETKTLVVSTEKINRDPTTGEETYIGELCIFDAWTYQVLATHDLLPGEVVDSMTIARLGSHEYDLLFVGTGRTSEADASEVLSGRALAFSILPTREYSLLGAVDTVGPVASLRPYMDKVACSIDGTIHVLDDLHPTGESSQIFRLTPKSQSHLNTLYLDAAKDKDILLAGDLFKSMSVLKMQNQKLESVAADGSAAWMTAVLIMAETIFLGADQGYNVMTLLQDPASTLLHCAGQFRVGDMINRFCPTSDGVLFGTVSGAIGAILPLDEVVYQMLAQLQETLRVAYPDLGVFEHAAWRAFDSGIRRGDAVGFIDGDLVRRFLDLPLDEKKKVVGEISSSVDEVQALIEDLIRRSLM